MTFLGFILLSVGCSIGLWMVQTVLGHAEPAAQPEDSE